MEHCTPSRCGEKKEVFSMITDCDNEIGGAAHTCASGWCGAGSLGTEAPALAVDLLSYSERIQHHQTD